MITGHLAVGDYVALRDSWRRSLLAANKSPRTIKTYLAAADELGRFLVDRGMPTIMSNLRREHVETWIADLLGKHKPATASVRYRAVAQFFKWAVEEGELSESPMSRMKPPIVPDAPVPVVGEDALKRLMKVCSGSDFNDRRDMAIIAMFIDTGVRRSECAGLKVDDVDLDNGQVTVLGKGRGVRTLAFGRKTAQILDRYVRARKRHRSAGLPQFWLGHAGAMTGDGLYQVVVSRAASAGFAVYPHQLRHTFAHLWQVEGGNESELMQVMGWKSRSMLNRYGASAAAERARASHRKLSPMDRL